MSKFNKWIKLWNEIKTIRTNADRREREFARDLRTDFESGERGDAAFIQFVTRDLQESMRVAHHLLTLAVLQRAVGESEFGKLGLLNRQGVLDKNNVTRLMYLPVRDQLELLESARKQSKSVRTVLTERERVQAARAPSISPQRVAEILDAHWEALEHAGIPLTEIGEFVARYAKSKKSSAA